MIFFLQILLCMGNLFNLIFIKVCTTIGFITLIPLIV